MNENLVPSDYPLLPKREKPLLKIELMVVIRKNGVWEEVMLDPLQVNAFQQFLGVFSNGKDGFVVNSRPIKL